VTSVQSLLDLEDDGALWASQMFASRVQEWYSEPQLEFWEFLSRVQAERGAVPFHGRVINAFIAIWGRGEAKTSSVEMGTAYLAARRARKFGIVVSKTLQQANERVANIADLLTEDAYRELYPEMGTRWVDRYGQGPWSQNHLRTAGGFELRAFGLNSPVRGVNSRGQRPDLIVFDDLDEPYDSAYMTEKKIEIIRKTILPARAPGAVVFGVQNLILAGGIFDQLRTGADWLANRWVSGPHPAIRDARFEEYTDQDGRPRARIVGGEPTWPRGRTKYQYQQELLDDIGISAFRVEAQHDLRGVGSLTYPTFSPERHAWRRTRLLDGRNVVDLPAFDFYVGGIDYGGEGENAHLTAVGYAGYNKASDTLILLKRWSDNGPGVGDRQRQKMYEWSMELGQELGVEDVKKQTRLIYWRAGADQYRENEALRRLGFRVMDSDRDGSEGSVRQRRERWMGDRLGSGMPDALGQIPRPRIYYVENSERWPEGWTLWAREMQRLRKKQPRFAEDPVKRETISVNDDNVQMSEYIVEEVELVHRRGGGTMAKEVRA
jgi:hypothetical protein